MKKKITLILALFLVSFGFAIPYALKCRVCMNSENRKKLHAPVYNAWRDFATPIIHKGQ